MAGNMSKSNAQQPQPQVQQISVYEQFLRKHTTIAGVLTVIKDLTVFILYGHFIKMIGQWLIVASGVVSETVLLFSAIWVTIANVGGAFITNLLGNALVSNISAVALLAFSVLPEIIVFSAVVHTYKLWEAMYQRRQNGQSWIAALIWALIYTPMSASFCYITLLTIISFVEANGHAAQITGSMLAFRCILAWSYGGVEIVYHRVGKKQLNIATLIGVSSGADQSKEIEELQTTLQGLQSEIAGIASQFQQSLDALSSQVSSVQSGVQLNVQKSVQDVQSQQKMDRELDSTRVAALQKTVEELQKGVQSLTHKLESGYPQPSNIRPFKASNGQERASSVDPSKDLKQRAREALSVDPAITGRGLAVQLGCSPTTANKLLKDIEEEEKVS